MTSFGGIEQPLSADEGEFRYYEPSAKAGILYIRSLSDETVLQAARDMKSGGFHQIVAYMERDTNPYWIVGAATEDAYVRGLITETEMDYLRESSGL
jgi:hypothetical protein